MKQRMKRETHCMLWRARVESTPANLCTFAIGAVKVFKG